MTLKKEKPLIFDQNDYREGGGSKIGQNCGYVICERSLRALFFHRNYIQSLYV